MRARQNLNSKRCYYVVTGDLNLLKRNLLACLQEVTSSLRLFRVARSGLQIIKYFSHRHKLQRLEVGLKGARRNHRQRNIIWYNPLLARTLHLTWGGHFLRSWMRNSRRTTRCIRFLTGTLLRSVTVACPT